MEISMLNESFEEESDDFGEDSFETIFDGLSAIREESFEAEMETSQGAYYILD